MNDRPLPQSIEAEERLLSCCLLDPVDVMPRCLVARIRPESFYDSKHGTIFARLIDLYNRQVPIDQAVLTQELRATKELEAVGGYSFITQISSYVPTTMTATYFISQVRDCAVRRDAIRLATLVAEQAADTSRNLGDVLTATRAEVDRLASATATAEDKGFTVWTVADFEKYVSPVGDEIISEGPAAVYWRERELAVLLGPGGVGKSRLVLNLAIADILKTSFIGFEMVGAQRRWLLAGNENSARRYKDELARMLRDLTADQRQLVAENLFIQAMVDETSDSLALDDGFATKYWRATAAKIRADVLVVDPWEAVIPGGDCNDAARTREGVRLLRAIFSPYSQRFTPLLVHHAREGAEAARQAEGFDAGAYAKGSKTLRSMARFVINVAPEDPDDGRRVVLACGKVNNAQKFATRGAVMDDATHLYAHNSDFDVETWRADVEGKRGNKSCTVRDVYEAVKSGNHTTAKIVEAVHEGSGACARTIKSRLKEAVVGKYLAPCQPRGSYTLGDKKL